MSHTTRRLTTPAAPQDNDWRFEASCRDEDPELFHPIGINKAARFQAELAKQVCRRCPVRKRCLQVALDTRQDFGVWGGTTEEERRAIHGRRGPIPWGQRGNAVEDIVTNRLAEFNELRGQGLSPQEIADRLRTNVQTVNRVMDRLAAEAVAEEVDAA